MFANRFTAFIDACSLASALKRNLLLSLAEADFFRIRWSSEVMEETEAAITKILKSKAPDPASQAKRARASMESAFADAMVEDYDNFLEMGKGLPDPKDAHVLAAALKTKADTIVTDNLKDFPDEKLALSNIEVRSTDSFIADTIALDHGKAVAAIRRMRERFKKPEITPDELLVRMEAEGLTEAVDILKQHVLSL